MWDRDSSQNRQEVARHDAVASRMPVVASTLIRQFTVEAPNRMRTTEGWLYLTVALALYSRFAISWAMGFRLTVDSPEQVLTMALPTRPQGPGSCTIRIAAANTPLRVTSLCRLTLCYDSPSEFEVRTAERNPMFTESRRGHFAQRAPLSDPDDIGRIDRGQMT